MSNFLIDLINRRRQSHETARDRYYRLLRKAHTDKLDPKELAALDEAAEAIGRNLESVEGDASILNEYEDAAARAAKLDDLVAELHRLREASSKAGKLLEKRREEVRRELAELEQQDRLADHAVSVAAPRVEEAIWAANYANRMKLQHPDLLGGDDAVVTGGGPYGGITREPVATERELIDKVDYRQRREWTAKNPDGTPKNYVPIHQPFNTADIMK